MKPKPLNETILIKRAISDPPSDFADLLQAFNASIPRHIAFNVAQSVKRHPNWHENLAIIRHALTYTES